MGDDFAMVSIHGRVFQKISVDEKIYCVPVANDDREEDRLTAQHDIFQRLLGDSFVSSTIRLRDPNSVLDCGYGGGDWCVQFAETFEDCKVTAIDIFPMGLPDQPDNLELFSYNLNDRLNDPEVFETRPYDLIHSRFVSPGIKKNRWASYIRDMRVLLRPGGWVQVAEYHLHIQSNSGRLTERSAVYRWWQGYARSMTDLQRDPRVAPRLQELVAAAGLRDVQTDYKRLPIGGWHPDPTQAGIGRDAICVVGDLLESLGLWPFTAYLGWTAAQFDFLIQEVRLELQDTELNLYLPIHIVCERVVLSKDHLLTYDNVLKMRHSYPVFEKEQQGDDSVSMEDDGIKGPSRGGKSNHQRRQSKPTVNTSPVCAEGADGTSKHS
ncbi:hypothetical protein HBI56_166380 [Parastagonospora nodorum]|nr:hypothetical protein HBH56_074140 [Parastagonospora nodorum]KAH3927379.1 hypothetical protein HBH54_154380 [Parastagonospora nodorum]KAH3981913.1 hypothetical protein HBH51_041140 [Parastagonospora nodorum]KAH3982990.1 hypothetical protein HBH52_068740 [Parastagonospora nodorum]KAH3994925.1 hypothetical protein HBI10_181030 [Parastagonospora nodorum]